MPVKNKHTIIMTCMHTRLNTLYMYSTDLQTTNTANTRTIPLFQLYYIICLVCATSVYYV